MFYELCKVWKLIPSYFGSASGYFKYFKNNSCCKNNFYNFNRFISLQNISIYFSKSKKTLP